MTRRCSHCSNNGHNSRTCPGIKLFGVRLTDGKIIKKSASMGNLSSLHLGSSSSAAVSPNHSSSNLNHDSDGQGYLSDDPAHSVSRRADRKKGNPWTEEEHRQFLIGLQKLGKGDWRGIARNYVITRTPTQVASHAQKYFIRQTNATRRKRRSSLFDMVPDVDVDTPAVPEEQFLLPPPLARESDNGNSARSLSLSLNQEQSMETSSNETVPEAEETMIQIESNSIPSLPPTFYPAYLSVPLQFWSPNLAPTEEEKPETSYHQVIKPIPIIPKQPVNVDELVGMSRLRIGETENGHTEPSSLSLKLRGTSSRQSAFHAKTASSESELSDGKTNEIQAV